MNQLPDKTDIEGTKIMINELCGLIQKNHSKNIRLLKLLEVSVITTIIILMVTFVILVKYF